VRIHAEEARGPVGPLDAPSDASERALDVLDDDRLERPDRLRPGGPLDRRRRPEQRHQHRRPGRVLELGRRLERLRDGEGAPAAEQRRPLDHRRELADVPRPRLRPEELDVLLRRHHRRT